jgi:hypothetical protein
MRYEELSARASGLPARRAFGGVLIVVLMLVGSCASFGVVEQIDSGEIVVIQRLGGALMCYDRPGPVIQMWGTATSYPKRSQYDFETQVRFNDGGHGTMKGSVQWEMPPCGSQLLELHQKFGSRENIQTQLVQKVTDKSVYMTGPLMSSKESYAEKRNYLISYVEDQIAKGVYRTTQQDTRAVDPLTGVERTVVTVSIVMDKNGTPARQEEAVLEHLGIKTFNFSISGLAYDAEIEKQINQQQQIAMAVQKSIAEARQAEQQTLTVEQQGKAAAAKAKWDQEVTKATEVTRAEQALAVQKLAVQTAESYKQEQTLRAEADANSRRKILEADGALDKKLATYEKVNAMWAEAFKAYPGQLVPSVVMGSGAGTTQNSAAGMQQMMELLAAKAAHDLALQSRPAGRGGGGN